MTDQPRPPIDPLGQRTRDAQHQAAAIAETYLNAAPKDPAPEPLPETKPALESATVWGGLAAVLGGLANIALIVAGMATADTLVPSLMVVWGGAQAIWGRWRATKRIDGVVGQP